MQNKICESKKYAPPLRREMRIGNTIFTVNSCFPEPASDTVSDKAQRLIKDELRKTATIK